MITTSGRFPVAANHWKSNAVVARNSGRRPGTRRYLQGLCPGILVAAIVTLCAPAVASSAGARLNIVSDRELEITGGTGKPAWRLRYGRLVAAKLTPQFALAERDRAWFSHGGWLRLIDTGKGTVIGRWHFPGEIARLTPQGLRVQVEVEERWSPDQSYRRILMFDPAAPSVPYWPANSVLPTRLPMAEAQSLLPASFTSTAPGAKVPADEARKCVPGLEETVRRDPHSPWFQIVLGRALKDIGDGRAAEVLRRATQVAAGDFTELMPISVFLDKLGESDLADAAFERGYRNFWERGNDPRLVTTLLFRYMVHSLGKEGGGAPESNQGRKFIERTYRLMPYGEAAELAWRAYADYLKGKGQGQEAELWRARAGESARNGTFAFWTPAIGNVIDQCILIVLGGFVAIGMYCLVLGARYRRQYRIDAEARKASGSMWRFVPRLNTKYWSRRERVALLSIVFVGWYTYGLTQQYLEVVMRLASMPISLGGGSYAGPTNLAALESRLPSSPERHLMVALACQQDGQTERAVELYRGLPQFPESWNNLGVIFKNDGKEAEARGSFEKALELDPGLAEAGLNLGRPPSSFWTELHQKYVPDQPMLAPPRGEQLKRALLGGSVSRLYLQALAGPFSGGSVFSFLKAISGLGS